MNEIYIQYKMKFENVMEITEDELENLRKKKSTPKKFEQTAFGKCLLTIPKHLLKVTICTIVFSFIFMIYIIYTEQNIVDLISSQEIYDFTNVKNIHPLFI